MLVGEILLQAPSPASPKWEEQNVGGEEVHVIQILSINVYLLIPVQTVTTPPSKEGEGRVCYFASIAWQAVMATIL